MPAILLSPAFWKIVGPLLVALGIAAGSFYRGVEFEKGRVAVAAAKAEKAHEQALADALAKADEKRQAEIAMALKETHAAQERADAAVAAKDKAQADLAAARRSFASPAAKPVYTQCEGDDEMLRAINGAGK